MVALLTFGFIGKKMVDFGRCPVVGTNDEAMVVHVQDEVLALEVKRERDRERGTKRKRDEERKSTMDVVDDNNSVKTKIEEVVWYSI